MLLLVACLFQSVLMRHCFLCRWTCQLISELPFSVEMLPVLLKHMFSVLCALTWRPMPAAARSRLCSRVSAWAGAFFSGKKVTFIAPCSWRMGSVNMHAYITLSDYIIWGNSIMQACYWQSSRLRLYNTPTVSLKRGRDPNECPRDDAKQSDGKAPGKVEYVFTAISSRFTLTRSGSTC